MFRKTFQELGLPENAHRIYLRLLENGTSSARQLAENLNIPRPSIYDNLKLLIDNELVDERDEENKKFFLLSDTKNLSHLVKNKIEILKKEENEINNFLKTIRKKSSHIMEPKIKFFPGVNGVKKVLNDLMWYDNIDTLTMWPISEMIEILGANYMEDCNRKRIRRNINIKGIWPRDKVIDFKKYPFMGVGKGFLRELRLAPKEMTWNMSYWLYEDKVAFISSRKELFGFIVTSRDFVELLKTQFKVIWPLCKHIKPQPKYTNSFLKTITK